MRKTRNLAAARISREVEKRLRSSSKETWEREEIAWLQASEIACSVADAWEREAKGWVSPRLREALDRLELVTRPSAMRKVRP